MKLHPFNDVLRHAEARMNDGWEVYQQFECGKCGVKQTMEVKDVFYRTGKCEECGHITNIEQNGCNFMAVSKGAARPWAS